MIALGIVAVALGVTGAYLLVDDQRWPGALLVATAIALGLYVGVH